MPLYKWEHNETGEIISVLCSYENKKDKFLEALEGKDPKEWRQVFGINPITTSGKSHMGSFTSEGFKDRLRAIKAANPGSTIDV